MTKVFQIIIVAIALTSTAYSQQVRSSYFSVNNMNSMGNTVRAHNSDEIIANSLSRETNLEMFAFISNAVVPYAILSSSYRVNDFVVLNDYIYFCGKNVTSDCGYIGMFNISTMGGFIYKNIVESKTLTKLVAYNGTRTSTTGIVAIGTPKNTSYLSCVVDLNDYASTASGWRYWYSETDQDYITDISLVNNDILVTVGKSVSSIIPKLYLRLYKRYGVLTSGMEDELAELSNVALPTNNGNFMVLPIDNDTVAIVGATTLHYIASTHTHGISVRKIDINRRVMNNYQFIMNGSGAIPDLEYFPSAKKLAILFNKTNEMGEVVFADLTKTSSYSPLKLQKDEMRFSSIARYDNDYFVVGCLPPINVMLPTLPILQENLNTFTESNCSSDSSVEATVNTTTTWMTINDKPFNNLIIDKKAPINGDFPEIPQTDITVHCANYYK